mmetsp:Transcript_22763/g.29765  ORF Transcript_22763/g.29765 Transcript_22763/m.29765 type:complete len:289 (+) Transcript_22763:146-1012(+)
MNKFMTRKQAWRKCRTRTQPKAEDDWENILRGEIYKWDNKLKKMQKIHTWDSSITDKRRVSTDSRSKSCTFGERSRKVGFDPKVKVILIPSCYDYDSAQKEVFWWSEQDRSQFKKSAYDHYQKYGHLRYTSVEEEELPKERGPSTVVAKPVAACVIQGQIVSCPKNTEIGDKMYLQNISVVKHSNDLADTKVFNFIDQNFFLAPSPRMQRIKRAASSSHIPIPQPSNDSDNYLYEQDLSVHPSSWPGRLEDDKHWLSHLGEKQKLISSEKDHLETYSLIHDLPGQRPS